MLHSTLPCLELEDGTTVKIEKATLPLVIGRAPQCQVTVNDHSISRRHAQITQSDNFYFIEDLGSRNGTLLNDILIQNRTRLHHGDQIQICGVNYKFRSQKQSSYSKKGRSSILYDDSGTGLSSILSKMDVPSASASASIDTSDRRLETLMHITRTLNRSFRLDETLQNVLDYLFQLFAKADRGVIVLLDNNGDPQPLATKVRDTVDDSQIRVSTTILEYVMGNKQSVLSHDVVSDDRIDTEQSLATVPIRSVVSVPLIDADDNAIGMIQLDTTHRQKAFKDEDVDLLTNVAIQSGMMIANSRLLEEQLESKLVKQEMEMAKFVQESLLPKEEPRLEGYNFYHFYRPMLQIGGDYFDYLELPDGRVAVIVGDVVGHGIPAALLMAKLSSECRMGLQSYEALSNLARLVNESFARLPADQYATLILTVLDPHNHSLEVMNAGHLPPMVRKADGSVQESCPVRNFAIGLYADEEIEGGIEYESFVINLEPGDSVLLHTDGLNEATNEHKEQYTRQRVREQFAAMNCSDPQSAVGQLIMDVGIHAGEASQDDDICLVCFQRAG